MFFEQDHFDDFDYRFSKQSYVSKTPPREMQGKQFNDFDEHRSIKESCESYRPTFRPNPLLQVPPEDLFDALNMYSRDIASFCSHNHDMDYLEEALIYACDVLRAADEIDSIVLIQMARDTLEVVLFCASHLESRSVKFLKIFLRRILTLQNIVHKSIGSGVWFQRDSKIFAATTGNFMNRTCDSYLQHSLSASNPRIPDTIYLLEEECKRSMNDLTFQLRMRQLEVLHMKQRYIKESKRQQSHYVQNQNATYMQYSDPGLTCCPGVIPHPPKLPRTNPIWAWAN